MRICWSLPCPTILIWAMSLFRYFPETLHQRFPEHVKAHRLKREVIATVLANAIINRGGPAFVTELMAATSTGVGDIAIAYVATRDIYGLGELNGLVDALDSKVSGAAQLELYEKLRSLLQQEVLWFLRNSDLSLPLPEIIARHASGVATLRDLMPELISPSVTDAIETAVAKAEAQGVPASTARRIAELPVLSYASDVVLISERGGVSVGEAAHAFFGVFSIFELWSILDQGRSIKLDDRFDRMALDRALANLMRAQRDLTIDVLAAGKGSMADRLSLWRQSRAVGIERAAAAVAELRQGQLSVSRLSVAAGLLGDLARQSLSFIVVLSRLPIAGQSRQVQTHCSSDEEPFHVRRHHLTKLAPIAGPDDRTGRRRFDYCRSLRRNRQNIAHRADGRARRGDRPHQRAGRDSKAGSMSSQTIYSSSTYARMLPFRF
ncbi:NAD-glutamate dehydrogenase [Devosia algicola]|uniref:NAD-glutamate dehydrogenase n=1 Tax=Devosia algicola TaxID=3026418 RepID=A0ABY7YND2_9HYPH|nr:NAD-glutamate dehydrogenase domain-containing protein [Devosia algicola]WDR02828.1 NAD-glutamate dehydrogenase [Devosia algicola]